MARVKSGLAIDFNRIERSTDNDNDWTDLNYIYRQHRGFDWTDLNYIYRQHRGFPAPTVSSSFSEKHLRLVSSEYFCRSIPNSTFASRLCPSQQLSLSLGPTSSAFLAESKRRLSFETLESVLESPYFPFSKPCSPYLYKRSQSSRGGLDKMGHNHFENYRVLHLPPKS